MKKWFSAPMDRLQGLFIAQFIFHGKLETEASPFVRVGQGYVRLIVSPVATCIHVCWALEMWLEQQGTEF